MGALSRVTVRVPAKVNLALKVGALGKDGFHPLETVFQAVDLYDEVTAEAAEAMSLSLSGEHTAGVPADATNLAWRAAEALAKHAGIDRKVKLSITKSIPVAGGMAGGSADAAGALLACDALWQLSTPRAELLEIAAALGSDVPFSLVGGTEFGRGRGHQLTTVLSRGTYHWVFALSDVGLSTPAVYREFDRLNPEAVEPEVHEELLAALATGEAASVARWLTNDLQAAAVSLQPRLQRVLTAGKEAGALAALVSGSGPTCAFLVKSPEHGIAVANELHASGVELRTVAASSPARGAHIVSAA